MNTVKLRFPSGIIGYELQCYMGFEDPKGHLLERPQIVQDMYNSGKCSCGKVAEYTRDEVAQLQSEVTWAADIKQDHIGGGNWTALNQYQLVKFGEKLNAIKW